MQAAVVRLFEGLGDAENAVSSNRHPTICRLDGSPSRLRRAFSAAAGRSDMLAGKPNGLWRFSRAAKATRRYAAA
jgi:hypothetical protein